MYDAYCAVKQSEVAASSGVELEQLCARYAQIY
jgi:hypothetical protein